MGESINVYCIKRNQECGLEQNDSGSSPVVVLWTQARNFLQDCRTAEGLAALKAVGDLSPLVLAFCRLLSLTTP